jgi:hypothetical protein
MGVDSLLAVELKNRIESDLATALPATLLFDHPSLGELADALVGTLPGSSASNGSNEPAGHTADDEALLRQIESLSEDDAERLLASLGGEEPDGPHD